MASDFESTSSKSFIPLDLSSVREHEEENHPVASSQDEMLVSTDNQRMPRASPNLRTSGKRSPRPMEEENWKRIRKESSSHPEPSNLSSSSVSEEDKIGQPRVAYPITAPLVKAKPHESVGGTSMLQNMSLMSSMFPFFPTTLTTHQQDVGSFPLSLGAMPAWNLTALAQLQAMQMKELLKSLLPDPSLTSTSISSPPIQSTQSPTLRRNTLSPTKPVFSRAKSDAFNGNLTPDPVLSSRLDCRSSTTDGRIVTTDDSSGADDDNRFRSPLPSTSGESAGVTPGTAAGFDGPLAEQSYQERRRRNNDSARRSRDARRTRIDETAKRVAHLEHENLQIRAMIEAERDHLARLHRDLVQRKTMAWNSVHLDAAVRQMLCRVSAAGENGLRNNAPGSVDGNPSGKRETVPSVGSDSSSGVAENLSQVKPRPV